MLKRFKKSKLKKKTIHKKPQNQNIASNVKFNARDIARKIFKKVSREAIAALEKKVGKIDYEIGIKHAGFLNKKVFDLIRIHTTEICLHFNLNEFGIFDKVKRKQIFDLFQKESKKSRVGLAKPRRKLEANIFLNKIQQVLGDRELAIRFMLEFNQKFEAIQQEINSIIEE